MPRSANLQRQRLCSLPVRPHQRNSSTESVASSEGAALTVLDLSTDLTDVDEFLFVESSYPLQLLTGLNNLRLSGDFCDVHICVDGEEFASHKIVLASFSPYFKAMFSTEMAESRQEKVCINGVDCGMIELLINYAYTAEILITKDNVQSLLSAANLLQVLPVRDACCMFMEQHMDESNCIGINCFAETHACESLQEKAKQYTLKHFPEVCQHEEILNLTKTKLTEFISDDTLNVDNEEIVFNAVIRWLEYDINGRQSDFPSVLEHVRLPLVSPYFLHDCVEKHPVVRGSEKCLKLVEEAKTYQLLEDRRPELRSPRTRHRKASGYIEVIIAVGGEDDKVVLRSVESFDPETHAWKTLACLPFAVSKHGLVVSGSNQLYMAGGEFPDGSASRSMWRYDACFDNWLEMTPMNMPRSELGLAMLDGFIYAVGGWEGTARLDTVERYNPFSNSWSFVAPMKISVTSPAVVAHDSLLFVTGGAVLEDGDGIDLVQCYNPRTNQWTELAPMLIARSGSAACVLGGSMYVIGGWHASTENTNKVECYNPSTNQWTLRASMHERRYRPGVAVVDGKIYVCGGEEGWDRYHDTIECYNVDKDEWEIVGEMPTSRSWLSCVAMMIRRDLMFKEKVESCVI
ncbi:kelch-like protein diablo [Lingula anatina]|uniref:Kelch-like protein diablo n=1 Tax=Lingula anatina TaxID=7574 RepID=A0A1S3IDL1_LINAN|nr:kelch-like protein diablo [Lingula anatina]|eukprot:XP_013395524.1 kelch-like protein diablo [Lingula anatina]